MKKSSDPVGGGRLRGSMQGTANVGDCQPRGLRENMHPFPDIVADWLSGLS